jgi:hypothetical protein
MKLLKIAAVFTLFTIIILAEGGKAFALDPYRSLCVGIQGRFYANSTWKGGNIQVGCSGDNGLAAPNQSQACTGEVQTIRPGQLFRLTKCSCFGSDKGCLKVGKNLNLAAPDSSGNRKIVVVKTVQEGDAFKKNSCEMRLNGALITSAGSDKVCGSNGQHITGNIKISCEVPSKTPTPTTPRPSDATPTQCPTPGKVTNVRITCPNCFDTFLTPTPTQQQDN